MNRASDNAGLTLLFVRDVAENADLTISPYSILYNRQMISLLKRWPALRQLVDGGDGTGPEAMTGRTRALRPRTEGASVARSICPYCAVGCGQLVFHRDGKLLAIEGDPESPISEGHLCPKGAASYELLTHAARELKVKYRAPRATEWQA